MEGCAGCSVDYNVCSSCRAGWDFDRAGLQCLRATLGLAAVVLALSVLTLLVGVLTCICACKRSDYLKSFYLFYSQLIPFSQQNMPTS